MFIDHFVWATPDLVSGMQEFYDRSGVMPEVGGRHPGRGTCNALVRISACSYLEILAPDPDESEIAIRWMQIDRINQPALIRWAWQTTDIDQSRSRWTRLGWDPGPVLNGSRQLKDGNILKWKLTDPDFQSDRILPFIIDWEGGPHPVDLLPSGCQIRSVDIWHPTPHKLSFFSDLQDSLMISFHTGRSQIEIQLDTPKGLLTLFTG